MEGQIRQLQSSHENKEIENDALHTAYHQKIGQLQCRIHSISDKFHDLTIQSARDIENIQNALLEAKSKANSLSRTIAAKIRELGQFQQDVKQRDTTISRLEGTIYETMRSNESLNSAIAEKSASLQRSLSKIKDLEQELAHSMQKNQKLTESRNN
jgi:methyl-accepting chemotaxis protein